MLKHVLIEINDAPTRELFGKRVTGVIEQVHSSGITRGEHGDSIFKDGLVVSLDKGAIPEAKVLLIRRHQRRLPKWLDDFFGYSVTVNRVNGTSTVLASDTLALATVKFK